VPKSYRVGDRERFWVLDLAPVRSFQVQATLRHITPHLYLWVQDDLDVPQEALERSAQIFDERLYPTVRAYFGAEWSPGIDNDLRLTVLHARFAGATGYFSSTDQYPSALASNSNQREMFYINPEQAEPGSSAYEGTLAHEFEHMVHWYADPNEDAWINEGMAELAMYLCGYSRDFRVRAFADAPDTPLTQWEVQDNCLEQHYGAAFLFMQYFAQRFGAEMTRDLVACPLNGSAGVDAVLQQHASGLSFDELFADWTVANYLSGTGYAMAAAYDYKDLVVHAKAERMVSTYPAQGDGTVHQYAADYIEIDPNGQNVQLQFTGGGISSDANGLPMTRLVPNQAHSASQQWWSNRSDNSDMTLTRCFDLSGLSKATLQAWLWYDIEDGWDFAYVEASIDGGATWQILPGAYTTEDNPSGNSYGPGYTGRSGAGESAVGATWIQDSFDLSPFVGRQTCIRFEYLTDEAVNGPGFCVDDVRIPELGYSYDAESSDGGWVAQGFVRTNNSLPQLFLVQLIRIGSQVSVEQVRLREDQSATVNIDGSGDTQKAILVVSAITPCTYEMASYRYELRKVE
jgi:immune inhibitor A